MVLRPRTHYLALLALLLPIGLPLLGCSDSDDPVGPDTDGNPGPDLIRFESADLYPEAFDYDDLNERFIVGSATTGRLTSVQDDGSVSTFADNADITSSWGIYVDEPRERVLAVFANVTTADIAALGIYDMDGTRTALIDLAATHSGQRVFANAIAVDNAGNIYITDSFSPVIYRVDSAGTPSVFFEDAAILGPAAPFADNGFPIFGSGAIALRENTLFVGRGETSQIFRFSLGDSPTVTEVTLSEPLPNAMDGIEFDVEGNLVVASNTSAVITELSSSDDWASAAPTGRTFRPPAGSFPAEVVSRGQDLYVLDTYILELFADPPPGRTEFFIRRISY